MADKIAGAFLDTAAAAGVDPTTATPVAGHEETGCYLSRHESFLFDNKGVPVQQVA